MNRKQRRAAEARRRRCVVELKEASVLPYLEDTLRYRTRPLETLHFRCKCAWNGHVVVKDGIATCPGCGAVFTVDLPERTE